MYRKYLFIYSEYYMTSEPFDPFNLFQLFQSLPNSPISPNTPNTFNKLNTSKVSGCPGSYMSKGVGFKKLSLRDQYA